MFAVILQGDPRLPGVTQGVIQQVIDAGTQRHRLYLQRRTMTAGLNIGTPVLGVFAQGLDQRLHIHPL
ncbi:hypothetical protein D3C73_1408970 [compost metagenome]